MPCKSWFCVGHNAWSSPIFTVDLILFKCFPQVSSRLSNWSFYFSLIGEYFPYQEPMVSSCFAGIRARWCFSYLLLLLFCSVRELFKCAKLYNLVILFFFFFFHFRYHFAFKPRLRNIWSIRLNWQNYRHFFRGFCCVASSFSLYNCDTQHCLFSKVAINFMFESENPYQNRSAYFPLCRCLPCWRALFCSAWTTVSR